MLLLRVSRYADRAKKIKNKPKINENPKDALLREMQEQVRAIAPCNQSPKPPWPRWPMAVTLADGRDARTPECVCAPHVPHVLRA